MMQLPLLATRPSTAGSTAGTSSAGAAAAGAPGSPAAAGREGSGFRAVLGELLGNKAAAVAGEAPPAQGSTGMAHESVPTTTEGASEKAGTPDGGAAAQADVTVAVPDAAAAFGQLLLSAPAVVPAAVLVPAGTPALGSPPAGLSGSDLPVAEPAGTLLTNNGTTDGVASNGMAAADPAPVAIPHDPAGPAPAAPAALTTPAASTSTAAGSLATPTASPAVVPEAGPALTTGQRPAPTAAAVFPAPAQGLPVLQQVTPAAEAATAAAPSFTEAGRLTPQLAGPLFSLASAARGQHVMTLQVSPEDLGPMTVRAHIDATGVRIELFAPGDAGRDALRTILPELRRGLAESGLGASLDLSEHGAPPDSGAGERGQDRRAPHGSQAPLTSAATAEPARRGRFSAAVVLPGTTAAVLDILV